MAEFIVVHSIKVATEFVPETFGRLTTIGPRFRLPVGSVGKYETYQVFVCSCSGDAVILRAADVNRHHTQSCGCLHTENVRKHGMRDSVEYRIWRGVKERCLNRNAPNYARYGGRGISIHPDWITVGTGFQSFYDYLGPRPSPEYSIDRIDNNGNYEPGNVRWATSKEQARNRSTSVQLTCKGKTQCVAAWAEESGISPETIVKRVNKGVQVEKAIFSQSARKRKL